MHEYVGGVEHDDFESRTGGVEHYSWAEIPHGIRRHGGGMIRCRR